MALHGGAAVARPLGAGWLAAHGGGPLAAGQREELKGQLLRELAARPGVHLGPAVESELQRFLDSGRVSESNLDRLERHVLARCGGGAGGSRSARSDRSAFSVAGAASVASATGGCRSARPGAGAAVGGRGPLLPVPEGESATPVEKWSQVAKYWKSKEDVEKVEVRERERIMQRQMAQDLQGQIAVKKHIKEARALEERQHFVEQNAEIERWRNTEAEKEHTARRRNIQEKQEREVQNAENHRRREADRLAKLQQDVEQVERAAQDLERDRMEQAAKKEGSRMRQQRMMMESAETKGDPREAKRRQHEEERQKVEEYQRLLGEQEELNRQPVGQIRGVDVMICGPPSTRKGKECFSEECVMKQLKQANDHAERKEREKIDGLREQKHKNQDFLFEQIAERNRNRERALEQKRNQKLDAVAATQEYQEVERRKVEEMRTKNVQHRLELERQMADRSHSVKPSGAEDKMTAAEKAINQRLLREVQELKKKHATDEN